MTLLTTGELREHVNTTLGDDALQRLLDDAEEEIVALAAAEGERTEVAGGGYRFIALARPASSITSIVEESWDGSEIATLASDDYLIGSTEMLLERLSTGTNPRTVWADRVVVVYTPVSTTATRKMVQLELVKLDIASNPGLAEQTIGDWTERYQQNSAWNAASERESILARLYVDLGMVVVGSR